MQTISIKELFAAAMPKLVSETIKWDGQQAQVFFFRMTMEESADFGRPYLNDDGTGIAKEKIKDFQAATLANIIRDADGNKIVTPDEIFKLDQAFYMALQVAAQKHNPAGAAAVEAAAKNSEATASSTTS